jgi:hypothetical protein
MHPGDPGLDLFQPWIDWVRRFSFQAAVTDL